MLRERLKRRTERWNATETKQRLELIEQLSNRLSKSEAPCRADLSVIKLRVSILVSNQYRDF